MRYSMNERISISDWRFCRGSFQDAHDPDTGVDSWEKVLLPHSVRIEQSHTDDIYQGECWYRTTMHIGQCNGRRIFLTAGSAMHIADLWVNGSHLGTFCGGYLPFAADISKYVISGTDTCIAIRLDNSDNPDVPPGRPEKDLDFHYYGGLHRMVYLDIVDDFHITDALFENEPAGGGIFVTYPCVSEREAEVSVKIHIRNDGTTVRKGTIRTSLYTEDGVLVIPPAAHDISFDPGSTVHHHELLRVPSPRLWHPAEPNLYVLRINLMEKGKVVHTEHRTIGIRSIDITADKGLLINGRPFFARGANRHNEYPHIGNAIPDNASYRDAVKIKEAGFDYVRLSHYPQPEAFLDACDKLGILVMNSIPGWQFFGSEKFEIKSISDIRMFIRRDRNHPCVMLWEACLNEAMLAGAWCEKAHAAAREEFDGPNFYTCGYCDAGYDVFIGNPAHGDWMHGCSPYYYLNPQMSTRHTSTRGMPVIVSEYGDWEYYSCPAGGFYPPETSSRQRRADGERRLLVQARNFQEAHNKNSGMRVIGDGIWVMFDYNRGCHPDIESSGIMDIFRLPKFAYYFFRSQRDPDDRSRYVSCGPMVYIASYWTSCSPPDIAVYSNCADVLLTLNGRRIPGITDNGRTSDKLRHKPFLFHADAFEPGILRAEARINGQTAAVHEVRTPGQPERMELDVDFSGRPLRADGCDVVFVHACIVDAAGTLVPDVQPQVRFTINGAAEPVFSDTAAAEAGIASLLIRSKRTPGSCTICAESPGLIHGQITFNIDNQ